MIGFSRRDLAIILLIVGLAAGWGWDHLRTTRLLRRAAESEQYFRQRLFEQLSDATELSQPRAALDREKQRLPPSPKG